MNILVIGGSRFTGREIIDYLTKKDYTITVFNRGQSETKYPPFIQNIKYEYPKNVKVVHGDRKKKSDLEQLFDKRDFEAIIDTCAYTEQDIQSLLNVIPNDLTNYVMISTASVYDQEKIEMYPIQEEAPIGSEGEDEPIQYSRDKRKAESLLRKNYQENQFPVTIFRPTYIYGPNNPMYREFYFFDRIVDKKSIYMPGTGTTITDFIFAPDLAKLLVDTLETERAIGEIYNATGEGAISLNDYVKILSRIIGKIANIIHYNPEILNDDEMKPENWNQMFPFDFTNHLLLSKEKLIRHFNYKPTSFENGIRTTFEWYSANKNPEWNGDYALDHKIARKLKSK